jgi:hypothetical protein
MACRARWILLGLAALLAATGLLLQSAVAAPPSPPSPSDAAAVQTEIHRVYDWAGYQREMPDHDEEEPKPQRGRNFSFDLGPLPTVIAIGLILILLVMVVAWLRSGGWQRLLEPGTSAPEEEVPAATRREHLRERLTDADRLAAAGDWAAAIHILLLTSIDLLRRRVGQAIPAAMTARELVGRAQVPDPSREDFAALVSASELCHFGGRSADRSLYDRCRVHYERLWGMPVEQAETAA